MASVIYIADPMCSWCYGFGPELSALLEGLPGLQMDIVAGGLRPYNTQAMDEELRTTLQSHWKRVQETTGLPFSPAGLTRENFVYNTEPACRAVVTARMLSPAAALPVFHAIQHAFFAEGKDVTQGQVLAEAASMALTQTGFAIDPAKFLETWNSEAAITATRDDFLLVKHWGISGFPTLVLERGKQLDLVTSGYVPMPRLVEIMQEVIDNDAAQTEAEDTAKQPVH